MGRPWEILGRSDVCCRKIPLATVRKTILEGRKLQQVISKIGTQGSNEQQEGSRGDGNRRLEKC